MNSINQIIFPHVSLKNYNPMNDVLFKFVFGKEERKQITIAFLNAVLEKSLPSPIEDLTFSPTEMNPEHENGKLTRLDVACILNSGAHIDIEVQVVNEKDMSSRTLFYWAQMYLMSLGQGKDYHDLCPCITVNILNFSILPQNAPHSLYGVYNKENGHRLTHDLELHFLEIPKFAKDVQKSVQDMTRMERWLAYFANKLDEKGKEELAMSEAAIKDAMDAAKEFLSTTAGQRAYINRKMAIMDYNSQIENAKKEGEERARKLMQFLLTHGKTEEALSAAKDEAKCQELYKKYGI